VAGGLTPLSKLPACNILLLGAQRRTLSGFSSTSVLPHTGFIYHSDIVQSLPPVGYELKEEIERKFDKWQEPPPVKQGLEIVNPQAAEKKVAEANQKYFSSMAEFLKVKGEKSGVPTPP
ncbi:hypothetical protein HGM15179_020343, partial [Zosterops borbonicus]